MITPKPIRLLFLTLVLAIALNLAIAGSSVASVAVNPSDEEAFRLARIVARGMFIERSDPLPVQFSSGKTSSQGMVRDYVFRVAEPIKGPVTSGDLVTVRCWDEEASRHQTGVWLEDEGYQPAIGQEMLVFLCPSGFLASGESDIYAIQTGQAGVYEITGNQVMNIDWEEPRPAGEFFRQLHNWSREVPARLHGSDSEGGSALIVTLLFWPAIIVALILAGAGIVWRRPVLVVVAATLFLPFALYLTMTPRFQFVGPFIPLVLLGGAVAVRRGNPWLAWILLAPVAVFIGWLGLLVLGD